jgi:tight adherence protein B
MGGFLFIAFLIFSGALLAAGYYTWTVPQRQANQLLIGRLRELRARSGGGTRTRSAPDLVLREKESAFAFLGKFLDWIGPVRRLQETIMQANLKYRASDVLALCFAIAVVVYFVVGILGMQMLALRILVAGALGVLPISYILSVRKRRLNKFEVNLPDTIDLFNRSMKAGHNIHAGLETIAAETLDPTRMEFRKVIEELALGSPLEPALHNLGKRVPIIDLKFFITGLILQRQTGANMVEVLENLSTLVRERLNLGAKMKAATAQQRFSAGLLCAMPIVVGLGFWILKPEYMRLLYTDETGSKFLTYAVVSEIVGILVIRKIASPKF